MSTPNDTIRERALKGDLLSGTFLNLGSHITSEIAATSGFDWVLIDTEHGAGGHETLIRQLQSVGGTQAAPIVRIDWNDAARFKRVLDLGAAGVMVPWVCNAAEAKDAVSAMRYPPRGIRGVASLNRGCNYGLNFDDYFAHSHERLLTVIQIERKEAVDCIDDIAAVDGVDVLFIGPFDLSCSLGIPKDFDNPIFLEACDKVIAAAKKAGKASGILKQRPDQLEETIKAGYTFVAIGSDGGLVANGMINIAKSINDYKK